MLPDLVQYTGVNKITKAAENWNRDSVRTELVKEKKLPNVTQTRHRRRQQKEQNIPKQRATMPQQHDDNKKNRRGLDDAQQGPDDTASDRKGAQKDKAPTEQGKVPDHGTNGDVSTGRRITSVSAED